MNQGTNGNADAIQVFPVDQFHSSLSIGTGSPIFANAGELWFAIPGLTANIQHLGYQIGEVQAFVLTSADFAQDLANGAVGTGKVCLQTNCILITPFLGDFTATSYLADL